MGCWLTCVTECEIETDLVASERDACRDREIDGTRRSVLFAFDV